MDLPKPSEWIDSMFQCYVFRDPSKPNPLSGINMLVCHNWFQNSKRMRFVSDGTIMDYQSHFTATMLYQLHNKYYILAVLLQVLLQIMLGWQTVRSLK